MEIIGEFWSRGGEKFSGDTGEVTLTLQNHVSTTFFFLYLYKTLFLSANKSSLLKFNTPLSVIMVRISNFYRFGFNKTCIFTRWLLSLSSILDETHRKAILTVTIFGSKPDRVFLDQTRVLYEITRKK